MRFLLMTFYFCGFMLTPFSQERATVEKLMDREEQRQEAAARYINQLKSGALLVRLDFDRNEIEYYEKYKNYSAAEKVREKALKRNLNIIDAFITHYNFSSLYFFDIDDSRKLLNGDVNGIDFYNQNGIIDTNIHVEESYVFVAEFGYIEPDTISYYSGSTPSTNSDRDPEGKTYYGGGKTSKPALVIRDSSFTQLREPFPYFRSYAEHGFVNKRYRDPVMRWNEKLHLFYERRYSLKGESEE